MEKEKKTILGIIGTVGSGKDTASDYISKKLSISVFQISQPLKDLAKEKNIEPTRENLIQIGSDLVKQNGPDFLAKLVLDKVIGEKGIVTGIRVVEIIEYMRKNSNFILLGIESEIQTRFERSIIRNKLGEATTLEQFDLNEQKENSAPNAQRLFECLKMADYSIENNGSLEEFYQKCDLFLEKFAFK